MGIWGAHASGVPCSASHRTHSCAWPEAGAPDFHVCRLVRTANLRTLNPFFALMSLLNSIRDTKIEDKEKLEEEFLDWLHELGYPEGSLFRGPSFHLKLRGKWREHFDREFGHDLGGSPRRAFSCYADLGILEMETSQYAALVEFRIKRDTQTEAQLATVFEAILDRVQTPPSIFLVTPRPDAGFSIFHLQENGHWRELPAKHFPRYATLTASFSAARTLNEESTQARNLDRFAITCRLVAAIIGAITLTSIIGLHPLAIGQILLLALAAVLLVAPEALGFRSTNGKGKSKFLRFK